GKEAIHWTRPSCHRFRANEARLLLGVIAYNLAICYNALPLAIQGWSLSSLRQRLFKTGGPHSACPILRPAACRKPLDRDSVPADCGAHRAARVAAGGRTRRRAGPAGIPRAMEGRRGRGAGTFR